MSSLRDSIFAISSASPERHFFFFSMFHAARHPVQSLQGRAAQPPNSCLTTSVQHLPVPFFYAYEGSFARPLTLAPSTVFSVTEISAFLSPPRAARTVFFLETAALPTLTPPPFFVPYHYTMPLKRMSPVLPVVPPFYGETDLWCDFFSPAFASLST